MRFRTSILLIPTLGFLALSACESTSPSDQGQIPSVVETPADTSPVAQALPPKPPTELIVRNKADYSPDFMEGLKGLGYEKIELIDSLLILDGKETHSFPSLPERGENITFTGVLDKLMIALHVERLDYTTVEYRIEMVEWGKGSHKQNGKAELSPGFFLPEEQKQDVHDPSGKSYAVVEFTDNREGDCHVEIRIGTEPMGQPYLLARLRKNCNGKLPELTSENAPLLHEK